MSDDENIDCEADAITQGSLINELARVVRYTIAAIGGYMVAQGYMSEATVELATGIAVTATPLIIGMFAARIRRRHVATVINCLKSNKSRSDETPKGD